MGNKGVNKINIKNIPPSIKPISLCLNGVINITSIIRIKVSGPVNRVIKVLATLLSFCLWDFVK
jgi:hypothetical protein